MRFQNRLLIVTTLTLLATVHGQVQQQAEPVKTTLCAIKAHPQNFQHKLVEFTATASHGFEDSMVEDSRCLWPEHHNPGVWMEYGGTFSTATMYFGNGSTNDRRRSEPMTVDGVKVPLIEDELFRQFDQRLHPTHPPQRASDTAVATLRGMMFVHREKINKETYWGGYGHMGCCLLLVVTQVLAVAPPTAQAQPSAIH